MKLRHGPGERVPFQRGVAGFLDRQGAFDVLLDAVGAAGPAVGIDLHPFPRGAAKDVVKRLIGLLRDDVPHGDLDGTPGRHQVERGAAHREVLEHHLGGVADAEGVAADHVFGEVAQQVLDDRFLAGGDVGFTPAVQTAFGFDAAEQQVLRGSWVEQECLDAGDFHWRVSSGLVSLGSVAGMSRAAGAPATRHRLSATPLIRYTAPMHPTILFQDQRFVVIDKPAGLPVHPGPSGGRSVEDWFGVLSRRKDGPWLVHRLDADTAGCLVIALRRAPLLAAQALFASGAVRKTYWAVVRGEVSGDHGIIDRAAASGHRAAWLAHARGRTIWPARHDRLAGARARQWNDMAGIAPRTGRTHQIRVHCATLGTPILGDERYGSRRRRTASAGPRDPSAARSAGRCDGPTAGAYARRLGTCGFPGQGPR